MLQKSPNHSTTDLPDTRRSGYKRAAFVLMLLCCISFADKVAATQKTQSVISITKSANTSITPELQYLVVGEPAAHRASHLNVCYGTNNQGAPLSVEPMAGMMGDNQDLRLTGSNTGSLVSFTATRELTIPASEVCESPSTGYINISIDSNEYKNAPDDTYLAKLILMVKPE